MPNFISKTDIAKNVVGLIVGAGTAKITKRVISNNIEPEKKVDKVTVTAASLVIGSMASDATRKYTDAKIDEIVDWWAKNVTPKLSN